jgi:hypothetical protein
LSTAVLPRVSSKNVRRLPSATTGTNTTPSWISMGMVDVSAGANQSASGMVGVGTGDCGAIGGVVTLMPAASRGGTGDGGGDIEGDGSTTGVMMALGAGDGVTVLGEGVTALAPGAGEPAAAAAVSALGVEEAAALGSGIARGAS